ncbi:hypothetical protein P43SY_009810 [Pythium insidiosum]|uniref:Complex 1 LYR protein domain-containing protein n=1 Tax=Pythium insidiosum TaxID=114742 RepID=A0AAD5M8T2_PYTIN|nr:hypothetical protein P43SY_009810 [Pythium insidiosum]
MSRARRPSAFKSLQYFLNRSQVLAQYHEFLRITQPLEDAVRRDVRAQIRSAFEMYRDVEDETKAAQLVRQGRDQLKHVSDLVDSSVARQRLATQQAEQSDTWLDSQAPTDTVDSDGEADVRGRIGQGWPWSKNKTVQKIELEGIRRLAKGRDTISAMESSNPDMPVPKPVKFVQDDEVVASGPTADVIDHFHKDCWLQQFDVCRVSDPSSPRVNLYAVHLDDLTTVQKVAVLQTALHEAGYSFLNLIHAFASGAPPLAQLLPLQVQLEVYWAMWYLGVEVTDSADPAASATGASGPAGYAYSIIGDEFVCPGVLPAQPTVYPQAPEPLSPGFDEPMTSDPGRGTPSPVQMAQPAGRATVMTGSAGLPMQTSAYMCPVRPFIPHRALELFDGKGSIS